MKKGDVGVYKAQLLNTQFWHAEFQSECRPMCVYSYIKLTHLSYVRLAVISSLHSLQYTIHIASHHTQTYTEKHLTKLYQKVRRAVSHHLEFN